MYSICVLKLLWNVYERSPVSHTPEIVLSVVEYVRFSLEYIHLFQ